MISTHRLLRRSFNNSWTIPCSRWLPFPVHRSRNYRVVVVTLGQSSTASDSRETFSRPATVALFPSLNGRNAEQRSRRPIARQWSWPVVCMNFHRFLEDRVHSNNRHYYRHDLSLLRSLLLPFSIPSAPIWKSFHHDCHPTMSNLLHPRPSSRPSSYTLQVLHSFRSLIRVESSPLQTVTSRVSKVTRLIRITLDRCRGFSIELTGNKRTFRRNYLYNLH